MACYVDSHFPHQIPQPTRLLAQHQLHVSYFTFQVSKAEIKISQDIEEKKRKIKTIKFPVIPSRDITYVTQAINPRDGRPDDVVACIYLGYVPRTSKYIHVHVYRFDTPETATKFVRFVNDVIGNYSERTRQIEIDFLNNGFIDDPRLSSSDGMSDQHTSDGHDSAHSTYSGSDDRDFPSDEIDPDLQSLKDQMQFDSVTDELKMRLGQTSCGHGSPLLLPPKDYDTISRNQGNLVQTDLRKSLNLNIIGRGQEKPRTRSDESGIDLASPSDEEKSIGTASDEVVMRSPPLSSRSGRSSNNFEYPAQTPRSTPHTPRSNRSSTDLNESFRRQAPNRQESFNSGYSSNSRGSSNGVSDNPNGRSGPYKMYRGSTEIPQPDYDENFNETNRYNSPKIPRSPLSVSQNFGKMHISESDYPVYASVNKQRSKSTKERRSAPFTDYYNPQPVDFGVRRVNSMYK